MPGLKPSRRFDAPAQPQAAAETVGDARHRHFERCLGVDFTSRPTRRKPIVVAHGTLDDARGRVQLDGLERFDDNAALAACLQRPGPWVGGFDLPFGLPRELVEHLGWPTDWWACQRHFAAQSRASLRDQFAAFCDARPVGAKFAHRACDRPAGSSPSMKWVNPPVAWMMHAGVPLLLEAGLDMPGLHAGDPQRVALEAYPGLLAREVLGTRSYKADDRARQTPERRDAREDLVAALMRGDTRLGLRLDLTPPLLHDLVDDPSGDALDATLCLVQAAWAAGQPHWGLPEDLDPLEGWIVSA